MGEYDDDLKSSEIEEQWLTDSYYKYFPDIVSIDSVPKGSELQYKGVDKIIKLGDNRTIYIDEKIRDKDYGDILLEEYSWWEKKIPGWIMDKDKVTNYIAYIIVPDRKISWLIDFRKLQILWNEEYPNWLKKYGRKFGKTYEKKGGVKKTTSNIPVPIRELESTFLAPSQSRSQNKQFELF